MPECVYKQDSEYGKVLNMAGFSNALHGVLNMPEYALSEF